jgi:small subunit ribosomal protein S16
VVRIRMTRIGRPHLPFYRVCAVDSRVKRDGAVLENLGWYDPMTKDATKTTSLNAERIKHWIKLGAQPSETVMGMLIRQNIVDGTAFTARRAKRIKAVEAAKAKAAAAPAAEKKPA